jgi:hypothetical protein
VKSRRQEFAIQRAQRAERPTRALSVAMPVLAYICRYNLEISTNASRDFSDSTQRASPQMLRKLEKRSHAPASHAGCHRVTSPDEACKPSAAALGETLAGHADPRARTHGGAWSKAPSTRTSSKPRVSSRRRSTSGCPPSPRAANHCSSGARRPPAVTISSVFTSEVRCRTEGGEAPDCQRTSETRQ